MTENTNIIVKGRKSKLSIHINEEKDINITPKDKKLCVKNKEECNVLQNQKKKNVKKRIKPKNICQKTAENLKASNLLSKNNKKTYEHQIQQLNLMLKQSVNYSKLTQEELNILFIKYKSDGHYRANENLLPFTNFLNKTCAIDENTQFYNQMQFVPDTEKINTKDSKNTTANLYYDVNNENQPMQENLSAYENIEPSLETTVIPETTNTDNRLYIDQNPSYNNHYNHMFTNQDTEICNNINVLGNIQNFSQSKSHKENHFSCNVVNTEKEHYKCTYTNKNLLYNIFNSDLQYENSNNGAILQSNDTYSTIQYNDLLLNPDFNNNNQSCKNGYSTVLQTNDPKSYYNVNNSQLTQIENYFENENNFNSPIHANTYSVINGKENLIHDFKDNISIQQDCLESANPNVISTNFSTEPSTFATLCPNMIN